MPGSHHILVVDDSHVISSLLDDFLTEKGFEVSVAGTAEEAYAKIREKMPDLIILDVVLPDVHGFQFCRVLKADPKTHLIPVIMATAKAIEVRDKVEGLKAGADDYVTKPFELSELYERVNAVLRRVEMEHDRSRAESSPLVSGTKVPPAPEPVRAPRPPVRVWAVLQGVLAEPAVTFSSFIHEPAAKSEFFLGVWMIVLIPVLSLLGRLFGSSRPETEVFKGLLAAAGAVSVWAAAAGAIVLLASLRGKKPRFQPTAAVIGLAALPLVLRKFLELIYIATGGRPGEFTSDPTLFLPGEALKSAAAGFLSGMDVFGIWSAGLLGIGFSLTFGLRRKNSVVLTSCLVLCVIMAGSTWALWMGGRR